MIAIKNISKVSKENIFRIITAIVSAFLFTGILPIMLFLLYMKQMSFFSYDFFSDGLFGLNTFFFFIVFTIVFFSLFLTSGIFFINGIFVKIIRRKYGFKLLKNRKVFLLKYHFFRYSDIVFFMIIFFVLNLLVVSTLYKTFSTNSEYISYLFYLISICALITFHFSNVVFAKAKWGLVSLLFVFSFITFYSISESKKTSDLVQYGLSHFNMGNTKVLIRGLDNNFTIATGQLLLLSPDNIFIINETNESKVLSIINREGVVIDMENSVKKVINTE